MGRAARRRERARTEAPEPRQMVTGEQPLPLAVQAPAVTTEPVDTEPPSATVVDLLEQLRRTEKRRRRLEVECDRLIDAAIDAGASFGQVGAALDISRQAVRQKHLRRA